MAKRKPQYSPRIIYVACEGTKTEYWYFKSLDEALDEETNVRVQVYPDQTDLKQMQQSGQKGVKTDPKSLCEKAAEKLQNDAGIDEAWIVIDKDGHSALEETFARAAKTGVHIAFSSISFEHWLLLHFEKNDKAYAKSDCKNTDDKYVKCGSAKPDFPELNCSGERCVAALLRLKSYLPDFDKSKSPIFKMTQPLHQVAYINAAWLRRQVQDDLETAEGKIFQINPYCNVDKLLKSIYQDDEIIHWAAWGTPVQTNHLELSIQKTESGYQVHLQNISNQTQVVLPNQFFFSKEDGEVIPIEFSFLDGRANCFILPNRPDELEILPEALPEDSHYLNFRGKSCRIIFSE